VEPSDEGLVLFKLSASGAFLWASYFSAMVPNDYDWTGLVEAEDGGLVLAASHLIDEEGIVIKTDEQGRIDACPQLQSLQAADLEFLPASLSRNDIRSNIIGTSVTLGVDEATTYTQTSPTVLHTLEVCSSD
jgi:hypothetical protein